MMFFLNKINKNIIAFQDFVPEVWHPTSPYLSTPDCVAY